ncbi:hypothetical protein GQ42DRAFT_117162 [Ramicandelaber brevisporus]|nr:hypothetical protein GQ42DRAFT_117162 [Ramicandelaber brevisporus]
MKCNLEHISTIVRDSEQSRIIAARVASTLNTVTGYSLVEALKRRVIDCEQAFTSSKREYEAAKIAHEQAVATRAAGQRAINDLLQRKHLWSDKDVSRFTELYREEHLNEQNESTAKAKCLEMEGAVEERFRDFVGAIQSRYHEEQLWSDKIRQASTYGTWAILGFNVLVFIGVQLYFEPRKRRRMIEQLDERLTAQAEERDKIAAEKMAHLMMVVQNQEMALKGLVSDIAGIAVATSSPAPVPLDEAAITAASTPVSDGADEAISAKTVERADLGQWLEQHGASIPLPGALARADPSLVVASASGLVIGSLLTILTSFLQS